MQPPSISLLKIRSGKKRTTYFSPAHEYWLNRFLRDYGSKIFLIAILFFGVILVSIVYNILNPNQTQRSGQIINITNTSGGSNFEVTDDEENFNSSVFVSTSSSGFVRIENRVETKSFDY